MVQQITFRARRLPSFNNKGIHVGNHNNDETGCKVMRLIKAVGFELGRVHNVKGDSSPSFARVQRREYIIE